MQEIPGAQPIFQEQGEIIERIKSVLQSGQLTQGPFLEMFESGFARQVGAAHAAGVSTGGAGLELILRALDVRGKEVIVPTDTFVASVFAVVRAGGIPVLADIDRETLAISPRTIEPLITSNTAAVMVVHMFGLMSLQLGSLKELCGIHKIELIEDAAHAHGACYRGTRAGSLGLAASFSFYATKIMTTGEGGMVTTSSREINERVRELRNYGKCGQVFEGISSNERLAEIPAILGLSQLEHLESDVVRRNQIAKMYQVALTGIEDLELLTPDQHHESIHSFWRFPLYLSSSIDRRLLQKRMAEDYKVRITWMYEPLCHLQPALKNLRHAEGDFPIAEDCMRRLICLPTHMALSDEDVGRVIDGLKRCLPLCRK